MCLPCLQGINTPPAPRRLITFLHLYPIYCSWTWPSWGEGRQGGVAGGSVADSGPPTAPPPGETVRRHRDPEGSRWKLSEEPHLQATKALEVMACSLVRCGTPRDSWSPIHLSICSSIHLSSHHPYRHSSFLPFIHPFIHSIHPSLHPSIDPSIHPYLHPPIDPSIHPSIHLAVIHPSTLHPSMIHLPIHSLTHPPIHPLIYLSIINLSIHLFAHQLTHPLIQPFIHLAIQISIIHNISFCLSIHPSHPSIHTSIYPSSIIYPSIHLSICSFIHSYVTHHSSIDPSIHPSLMQPARQPPTIPPSVHSPIHPTICLHSDAGTYYLSNLSVHSPVHHSFIHSSVLVPPRCSPISLSTQLLPPTPPKANT